MNAACSSVTSLDGSMRDRAHKRVCVVLFYYCVASSLPGAATFPVISLEVTVVVSFFFFY